jgi:hypothetical protein
VISDMPLGDEAVFLEAAVGFIGDGAFGEAGFEGLGFGVRVGSWYGK